MHAASQKPVVRHLVLWLTTDCNLSCSYCYRCDPDVHEVMNRGTAMAALEFAAQSGQPFHVQMAGGEPTLEPGLIEFVARNVRIKGWPATLAVQTNAVAMTSGLADLLRRYQVGVGVSLDGPPLIQDFLRGKSNATLRGLDLLERAEIDFNVTAVVSAANLRHLPQLALLLSRFSHARGLGLDLLVQRGRAAKGVPAMAEPGLLVSAMKELSLAMAWLNRRRKKPLILRELERIKTGTGLFCHAASGASLALHPDGRLYPCGQTMGDHDVSLGTIHHPDLSKLNCLGGYELRSARCVECPLNGRCPGECPSRLKYNGSKGHELACAMLHGLAFGLENQTNHTKNPWGCDYATA